MMMMMMMGWRMGCSETSPLPYPKASIKSGKPLITCISCYSPHMLVIVHPSNPLHSCRLPSMYICQVARQVAGEIPPLPPSFKVIVSAVRGGAMATVVRERVVVGGERAASKMAESLTLG